MQIQSSENIGNYVDVNTDVEWSSYLIVILFIDNNHLSSFITCYPSSLTKI